MCSDEYTEEHEDQFGRYDDEEHQDAAEAAGEVDLSTASLGTESKRWFILMQFCFGGFLNMMICYTYAPIQDFVRNLPLLRRCSELYVLVTVRVCDRLLTTMTSVKCPSW